MTNVEFRCDVRWGAQGAGYHNCKLKPGHAGKHECPHGDALGPTHKWDRYTGTIKA